MGCEGHGVGGGGGDVDMGGWGHRKDMGTWRGMVG